MFDLLTRECLAIDVGQGLSGKDLAATLDSSCFRASAPSNRAYETDLSGIRVLG